MNALLWLTITSLFPLVMSYDPSLSNGTCYFGANKQADSGYIPCGNAAGGVQSCCQARDVCLSSNACFNGQYYVTYLAGCTDKNYADGACPNKGQFSDQQWVGLVRCMVSNGNNEQWGGCSEPMQPKLNKGNQNCVCNATQKTALFTDAATLTNIASLPVSAGNAIAWFSGFTPSTTITGSGSTSAPSTSVSATGSQSQTITAAASSSPTASSQLVTSDASSTLSAGAKAGIGVGTAAGVVAVVALLIWFILQRRRKQKEIPPVHDQIRPSSMSTWIPNLGETKSDVASTSINHRSWGGRSELPTEANEVTTIKTSLGERSSSHLPGTIYQAFQNSPTTGISEADGSPAASTSRLTTITGRSTYEKPVYGGNHPVYEMPA